MKLESYHSAAFLLFVARRRGVIATSKVRVGGFQAVDPAFAGKFDLAYRRIERDLRIPL